MHETAFAQLRSLKGDNEGNSTCYFAADKITEKDSSAVPFFLYFVIAFACIRAFKILVDLKQLQVFKQPRCPPSIAQFFTPDEF